MSTITLPGPQANYLTESFTLKSWLLTIDHTADSDAKPAVMSSGNSLDSTNETLEAEAACRPATVASAPTRATTVDMIKASTRYKISRTKNRARGRPLGPALGLRMLRGVESSAV